MLSNGDADRLDPGPGPADIEPLSRWQKFRMIVKVVELRLRFIALMTATGLVFGYWDTIWNYYEKWTRPPVELHAAHVGTEYYCPMHPSVIQAEPGNCPICGMPLSKRAKGEKGSLPEGVVSRVQLAPTRVQQAGIRTVSADYEALVQTVTTVGFVDYDERRLARIASRARGLSRVEKLLVNFTGISVERGEPLAELYSPELYQAVQELLLAHRSKQERPQALSSSLGRSLLGNAEERVRLGTEKLRLWGITQAQIDAILAEGKSDPVLPVLSPLGGVVVKKNVVEGQYVAEGQDMFEVADLTHVWIQAQIYEDQIGLVKVGQTVEAAVPTYPGEVFRGTVAFIDPILSPATRTVNVRYDIENADLRLRPGMFATVTLKTPVAEIPAFRKARFATALSEKVRAGGKAGGGTPKPVSLSVAEQKICPVTGLKLGAMGEPVGVSVEGRKVWTCCESCSPKLIARPAGYLARLAPPPADRVLSVPESAVIDTGQRKLVYVETEPGVFEGREVVLGPRSGDRYPVLRGLMPGDKVAAAGAFLIDAESRLNPAASGLEPSPAAESGSSGHAHPASETPPRAATLDQPRHRH